MFYLFELLVNLLQNLFDLFEIFETVRDVINVVQQKIQVLKTYTMFHYLFLILILLLIARIIYLLYERNKIRKEICKVSYVRKISPQYYDEYKRINTQQALYKLKSSKEYKDYMLRLNDILNENDSSEVEEIYLSDSESVDAVSKKLT